MRKIDYSRDSRRFTDWMKYAQNDLRCAEALSSVSSFYNAVLFHAQQAIEKSLKAFILFKTGDPVDGHNITWLCRAAAKSDNGLNVFIERTTPLNRMYIETRYPSDEINNFSYEKCTDIIKFANEIYKYVNDKIIS